MSVRNVLGRNLRHLTEQKGTSISEQCRDMDIHRTQFNRYLNSETWPRDPDTLKKICDYYGVDANVLFRPVRLEDPINVGETYIWEPDNRMYREEIVVTAIEGDRIFSQANGFSPVYNDESRFREACIRVEDDV